MSEINLDEELQSLISDGFLSSYSTDPNGGKKLWILVPAGEGTETIALTTDTAKGFVQGFSAGQAFKPSKRRGRPSTVHAGLRQQLVETGEAVVDVSHLEGKALRSARNGVWAVVYAVFGHKNGSVVTKDGKLFVSGVRAEKPAKTEEPEATA